MCESSLLFSYFSTHVSGISPQQPTNQKQCTIFVYIPFLFAYIFFFYTKMKDETMDFVYK